MAPTDCHLWTTTGEDTSEDHSTDQQTLVSAAHPRGFKLDKNRFTPPIAEPPFGIAPTGRPPKAANHFSIKLSYARLLRALGGPEGPSNASFRRSLTLGASARPHRRTCQQFDTGLIGCPEQEAPRTPRFAAFSGRAPSILEVPIF